MKINNTNLMKIIHLSKQLKALRLENEILHSQISILHETWHGMKDGYEEEITRILGELIE